MFILDGSLNKDDTSTTLDKYMQNLYGLLNEKFSSTLICSHHQIKGITRIISIPIIFFHSY